MDKNEALQVIRSNYPTDRNQLCEALETLIPELKESEYGKPCGGIVLEDFNGGEGFYKVNLAYLNKEQVIEIEELVKKWNPELKESEDEEIRHYLINFVKINDGVNLPPDDAKKLLAWLEKQGKYACLEEDKKIINLILENLTELKKRFGDGYGRVGDCIIWLNSLKQRMKGE